MRRKNSRLALAFLCACAGAIGATGCFKIPNPPVAAPAGWKEYVYASDGFAITAPQEPKFTTQKTQAPGGEVEIHQYMIELPGDYVLSAVFSSLPGGDTRSASQILSGGRDGMVAAVKGTLTSETSVSFGKYPGLQVDVKTDAYHLRNRFFLIDQKLYQLMSGAPGTAPLDANTEYFFNSFRLTNSGK